MLRQKKEDIVNTAQRIFTPELPKMTWAEYNRRRDIWEAYYKKVRDSKAYQINKNLREALLAQNKIRIRELLAQNMELIESGVSDEPTFPDPEEQFRKKQIQIV